jgi:hypothetical protein
MWFGELFILEQPPNNSTLEPQTCTISDGSLAVLLDDLGQHARQPQPGENGLALLRLPTAAARPPQHEVVPEHGTGWVKR